MTVHLGEPAREEHEHRHAERINVTTRVQWRAGCPLFGGRVPASSDRLGVRVVAWGDLLADTKVQELDRTVVEHDVTGLEITVDDRLGQ